MSQVHLAKTARRSVISCSGRGIRVRICVSWQVWIKDKISISTLFVVDGGAVSNVSQEQQVINLPILSVGF